MTVTTLSQLLDNLNSAARGVRQPRPSSRNLEIYETVHVHCVTQADVAAQFRISQSRVSAICRQVERWRGTHEPRERGEPQGSDRVRVERWIARRRLEDLYGRAVRQLERSQTTLMTVTDRHSDGKKTHQQTLRAQQSQSTWMRLAMRAAEKLLALAELPEPPQHVEHDRVEYTKGIVKWLSRLRDQARRSGRVAPSDPDENPEQEVAAWLRSLLGMPAAEPVPHEEPPPSYDYIEPAAEAEAAACSNCSNAAAETAPMQPTLAPLASDETSREETSCDRDASHSSHAEPPPAARKNGASRIAPNRWHAEPAEPYDYRDRAGADAWSSREAVLVPSGSEAG